MQKKAMVQAYSKTSVETSDQLSLILMLYDGMLRFMKKAATKIAQGDIEGAHSYIVRSRDIVSELLSTLKVEGEGADVGANLRQLYLFVYQTLVEANMTKDAQKLESAIKVIETLRQGWIGLREQQQKQKNAARMNLQKKKFNIQG